MLQESQATLDNNVLEDGSRRNVNCLSLGRHNNDGTLEGHSPTEVDRTSNGQMVKLNNLGNAGDPLLEVGHLLEVAAELDERRITETSSAHLQLAVLDSIEIRLDQHQIRAGLDGQEAATGHIDTVRVLEVLDGGTDSGLELENANIRLTLLVARNGLAVGDDLHLKLIVLDNTLDGLNIHPDVVGVEVLELLDRLELVDVLLGNLGNFQKAHAALVINDGTTLDIGLSLVGQLHNVLRLALNHVLKDAQVNNGAKVISVGEEDDLNTAVDELVENAGVVERLEDVTVSRRVPVVERRVERLGHGKKRVFEDSGIARLVEGEDIDVMTLILLDNSGSVLIRVERVHEDDGHIGAIATVKVLDLTDRHVEERHAITDLDDGLGADATHGGTQTTVQLENGQFVEEADRLGIGEALVVDNLISGRGGDAVPRATNSQI